MLGPSHRREHPLPHLGHAAVVLRAYFAGDLADQGLSRLEARAVASIAKLIIWRDVITEPVSTRQRGVEVSEAPVTTWPISSSSISTQAMGVSTCSFPFGKIRFSALTPFLPTL